MTHILKIAVFKLFAVLTVLQLSPLHAQNYYTRNISIENGLPSNSIQDIFKDSRGLIWIGTEAGLCRFDGVNFKIFTTNDGLPGNRIWSITEDTSGNLWLACYGNGISKFDGKTFQNYSSSDGLVNDNVRKIRYSEKSNGLLIWTLFGFSFFKDSVFTSFTDSTISDRNLLQVTDFIDCDSTVYLLTYYDATRFIKFNPYTKAFEYLPVNHRYHTKSQYSTSSYISSENDTIIADYIRGVKVFSKDTVLFYDNLAQVFDITEDKNGDIWVASWNDMINTGIKGKGGIYRLKDNKTYFYSDQLGIKTQLCWSLFYDEDENLLWIGTLDKGLFIYSMSGMDYKSGLNINSEKAEIHDIIIDSEQNLWLSAGDRIYREGEDTIVFKSANYQGVYKAYINTFYEYLNDPEGNFNKYRNISKIGYNRFSNPYLKNGKIQPKGSAYDRPEFMRLLNINLNYFDTFFEDSDRNIWIKTNLGLYKTNKIGEITGFFHYPGAGHSFIVEKDIKISILESHALIAFSPDSAITIPLRKNITYASYCNYFRDKDSYWIFNDTDGILKYKDGKVTRFDYLRDKMDLSITSLTGDKRNNLIAGTNSGLIYILSTKNDSILVIGKISSQDGIRGSDIKWVLTDNSNRLWFSTNEGLNMADLENYYNNEKKNISFFNEENGFFDKRTFKAILYDKNKIAVISENNILRFDPDELINNSRKNPKLKIEKIEINFNEYFWPEEVKTDKWTGLPEDIPSFSFDKNTISFYFHLLEYSEPLKAEFSYKLNEIQNNWTDFSREKKAVFTNLRPGSYTLNIRSRILSNPDSHNDLIYTFRILPPWYLTWWFKSLTLIFILSAIYIYIVFRIGRIKKESEINQKLAALKLEALKAQMNPHFIFNAFNSIQKYILNQDSKSALVYMSDFAALIRKTLDNSTKEQISLSDEISYLTSYLDLEKRRITNLNYKIELDNIIDPEELLLPPMLIQPIVENSILHGIRHMDKEGMILINFSLAEISGRLICFVEDNGIGRLKSTELYKAQGKTHLSLGSKIIQQRAALFEVTMKISDILENENSAGTKVEFYF